MLDAQVAQTRHAPRGFLLQGRGGSPAGNTHTHTHTHIHNLLLPVSAASRTRDASPTATKASGARASQLWCDAREWHALQGQVSAFTYVRVQQAQMRAGFARVRGDLCMYCSDSVFVALPQSRDGLGQGTSPSKGEGRVGGITRHTPSQLALVAFGSWIARVYGK